MKRFITLFITFILLVPTIAFAHKGRTDGNGGHYNSSTGEYHYHHGYSAHQHINGICPYENNVNSSSENTSSLADKIISGEYSESNYYKELVDDYRSDLAKYGYSSISAMGTEIEKLNTKISDMWFWFIIVLIASVIIAYYLGKPNSNKTN